MRRITMWLLITATIFVLLFSYHTSTDSGGVTAVAVPVAAPTTTSATASTSTSTSTATSAVTPTSTPSSSSSQTFTGSSVDTRWGPVQVQITVAAGKITAATAVVYPQGNHRDEEINAEALPVLEQEAVAAQNAKIDMVSGATVTSDGYISSLQSAIDQANIG